ncbi:MAG: Pr6Pr family membrane protein [Pseudomonadota bacterium]
MQPSLPPAAQALAAVIVTIAIASLVAQFFVVRAEYGYGPGRTIWVMARFLTLLTTALIAITFTALLIGQPVGGRWLAALTLADLLVAAGFHLLLRGINEVTGLEVWSDLGYHTLIPILMTLYWLVFAPKSDLVLTDVPFFLVWPGIYLSYALTRGGLDGIFPYPFLDPSAIGWTPVFRTIGVFTLGLLVAGSAMVLLGRLIDRA